MRRSPLAWGVGGREIPPQRYFSIIVGDNVVVVEVEKRAEGKGKERRAQHRGGGGIEKDKMKEGRVEGE